MGWINRAKAKASHLLWYLEQDGKGCVPTSQHCYFFVPYLMDLRCAARRMACVTPLQRPARQAGSPHGAAALGGELLLAGAGRYTCRQQSQY